MKFAIVLILVITSIGFFLIHLKSSKQSELEDAFYGIYSLNRHQLKEMCDDLLCYEMRAAASPKKRVPLEISSKYGCCDLSYADAKALREAAVKRHDYLSEKEETEK